MSDEKGFLTKVDREFLTGEREYTGDNAKQQRYERREAIAARARQAFRDFELLFDELDEQERNRIFDVGDAFTDHEATNEFHDALVDTLAFMYLSLEGEIESNAIRHRSFRVPFDTILRQAVKRGEAARYERDLSRSRVHVEFDVDVQEGGDMLRLERAIEKVARMQFNELTEEEMYSLLYFYEPDGALQTLGGEGGYSALDERIREKRDELGVGAAELSDEELDRLKEDVDRDVTDDQ